MGSFDSSKTRYASRWFAGFVLTVACGLAQHGSNSHSAASDPGPRGGPPGAGGTFTPINNISTAGNQADQDFFLEAKGIFQEVVSVSQTIAGTTGGGLGPAFNHNSCAACHIQPALGGSSPAMNPQVVNNFAHLDGAFNPADTSGFLSANGPVREVRFIQNPNGSLDGGVHDIFSIAGRTDAPGCNLQQPNFDQEIANHNAIFRIPTPLFGDGLVEMVADSVLEDNLASTASQRAALGIGGVLNTSGNDGTVTRFGWKAQNKSMLMFAGEAYNVEMGVTNNLFQSDRFPAGTSDATVAACTFNTSPEDYLNTINGAANTIVDGVTKPNPNLNTTVGTASEMSSDIVNFASFAELLAPPTPTTSTASQNNGLSLFKQIGCVLCHSQTLVTNQQNGNGMAGGAENTLFTALGGVTIHPFSDYAIHHMGSNLSDGINQGGAGPDQFRTAPLWGAGQRLFFLHDGRTSDLMQVIQAHFSPGNVCTSSSSSPSPQSQGCGSEANQVIQAFNDLESSQQQDLLNFLRSL